jgi:hypothetical protein
MVNLKSFWIYLYPGNLLKFQNIFLILKLSSLLIYLHSIPLYSQQIIGTIARSNLNPGSLAVYETGNKLFVGDWETGNLLVYDGTTLDSLAEIPIDGGCGGSCMVVHEESGKLFLGTFPRGDHIAVVNMATNELIEYIEIDGMCIYIDEELGIIYTISDNAPFILYAIDVHTHEVTSVDLSNAGLTSGLGVNPITHEVFIGYLQGDSLDIVDGTTGERTTVSGINGRGIIVNWLENKVYGELGTYNGFWVYDRDIDSMKVHYTYNDANPELFNPVCNRVYTGSEVNGESTIIDCDSDAWFNIPMYSATVELDVRLATNHVYYVGFRHIVGLDGSTLERFLDIASPSILSKRGQNVAINQSTGRVFISFSSYSDSGTVMVIQDLDTPDGLSNADRNYLPSKFILHQNSPNPFNPKTYINYQLAEISNVELIVYNLLGQKVATLVAERKQAGKHQVGWDAYGFATGVYYYRIRAGEFQDVKKMILLR